MVCSRCGGIYTKEYKTQKICNKCKKPYGGHHNLTDEERNEIYKEFENKWKVKEK